jgi:hypothetical protein
MTRKQKTFTWLLEAVLTIVGVAVVLIVHSRTSPLKPILLTGAVLRDDTDPEKQTPLSNVAVSAVGGSYEINTTSDASGFFKLTVYPRLVPGRTIVLSFAHAGYKPVEIMEADSGQLYVVRMEPLVRELVTVADHTTIREKAAKINHVRVRYSFKDQAVVNVGSIARQFKVVNTGNLPCHGQRPCSPDGKWKASTVPFLLEAPKGDEFRNVRASCVAGPCPFTRLDPPEISRPVRSIHITALNWSDTAGFLVEAEVVRTMATDRVHQSVPFIRGQTMSFALPAAAEGPSILADINGQEIVFPLGPHLILSWAGCSIEAPPGGNKIYRCELKPGFEFQQ